MFLILKVYIVYIAKEENMFSKLFCSTRFGDWRNFTKYMINVFYAICSRFMISRHREGRVIFFDDDGDVCVCVCVCW